jgi:multiple sugar transport system substrate-binding protein
MWKQRAIKALILLLAAMVFLSACSSGNSSNSSNSSGGGSSSGGNASQSSGSSSGGSGGDKPLAGVTLNVLAIQDPFFDPLKNAIPEFEALTGAKVNLEGVEYNGLRNKIVLDNVGGSGTYDIISLDTMWTGEFVEAGYIIPLDDYVNRDAAEFDPGDIPQPLWEAYKWKGKTYGVPLSPYTKLVLYRKDLWEDPNNQSRFKAKYGYDLQPPKTWDQFRDMAEFFTGDWGNGQQGYGVAFNAKQGASIVHMFYAYADNFGAKWFKSYPQEPWDFTPMINTPEAVEALEFYVGLRKFAPPEVVDFEWFDTGGAFWNGQVAMIDHWSVYASMASDPSQSKIVGNIAAAIPPGKTEDMAGSQMGGWALSINSISKQQDAAWEFVKWATGKETMLKMVTENVFDAVSRESVLSDPAVQEKYPWAQTYLESLKVANPEYKPRIPAYVQMEEVLGVELNAAMLGAVTPQQALDTAQEKIIQILKHAQLID